MPAVVRVEAPLTISGHGSKRSGRGLAAVVVHLVAPAGDRLVVADAVAASVVVGPVAVVEDQVAAPDVAADADDSDFPSLMRRDQ